MLSIRLSLGLIQEQGILIYRSASAIIGSLFSSTRSQKDLVPVQLSSATIIPPLLSMISGTLVLPPDIGQPEIIILGLCAPSVLTCSTSPMSMRMDFLNSSGDRKYCFCMI